MWNRLRLTYRVMKVQVIQMMIIHLNTGLDLTDAAKKVYVRTKHNY